MDGFSATSNPRFDGIPPILVSRKDWHRIYTSSVDGLSEQPRIPNTLANEGYVDRHGGVASRHEGW
ncbi:hypothetical protein E4U54_000626 [Claviceps lovelessii]|nr:hypothetical protein E4U54_000626 [Claviceps lovelessii]